MTHAGAFRTLARTAAAALVLAATLAAPAAATAASPPTSPPTVDEIVARHIAARGGAKKLRSIETLRQKGRVTAGPGRQAVALREIKRPGRTRFEFTVQGVTAVYVSDGRQGWQISPFDGVFAPEPLAPEVVQEAAEQADFEGPLVDWKAKGHQVELAGVEVVGGRETYRLKLTLAGGAVRHDYLDAKSMLLVRTVSTRQVRGRAVQVETDFGDHKKTKGVVFPRRIEVGTAGRPERLRVVVDEIEVNPPLSDVRFQPPPPRP